MKRVVIVGPQTTLGREIGQAFAQMGARIAFVAYSNLQIKVPSPYCKETVIDQCKSLGATASLFSGDLLRRSEWERIMKEITSYLDGKIDHFCYFHGVMDACSFGECKLSRAHELMQYNFVAPCLALSAALPLLKVCRGHITIMASDANGRGSPDQTLYTASKRAIESYARNVGKSTGLQVTFLYPGVEESLKNANDDTKVFETTPLDEQSVDLLVQAIVTRRNSLILAERKSRYCEGILPFPDPPVFRADSANALCRAIQEDNAAEIKEILKGFKRNPDMIIETDCDQRNALHYAANTGNTAALEALTAKLRKQATVSSPDKYKWTPLHYAAWHGHLRVVRRLLREGADSNAITDNGISILHLLARLEPDPESRFFQPYIHTLKNILELGGDTNQRNRDWATPVHEAAAAGSLQTLQLFLKNEGDPHRKTKTHSRTPLAYAIKSGEIAVVKLLLESGSDPVACFELAPEEMQHMLEDYREKNCRPDSAADSSKKEVIVIKDMDDFPSAAKKMVKSSGLLETDKDLVDQNWKIFLFILRFLTRKIYLTPEEFAKNSHNSDTKPIRSRTLHGMDIEAATSSLVTTGNPRKMFKIMQDVGRGGFGSVSMVKRLEDKKQVAIKKVPHLTEKEQWSNLDEIYFLQQCKHSCIVKYENAYISRDEMWMVMEFMEGGSLSQSVQKYLMKESQICYVTKEILRGLRFMHSKGYAHRDLKSANIMLTIHGDIKIIDFGLCVEVEAMNTGMVGSPFWIPPEMIQKKEHGTPADIWSLAILCLEMAHGRPPHRDSALKAMFRVAAGVPPTFEEPSQWSDLFKDFLSKMLVIDPAQRATAAELLKHPWIEKADTRAGMMVILQDIFIGKSLEKSLGISV